MPLKTFITSIFVISFFISTSSTVAQTDVPWPMAGANPGRTSWSSQDLNAGSLKTIWAKPIAPYVSQHIQVVGAEGKVFVSTAAGLYAFDANTGADLWQYATALPLGNSPTYANGFLYIAGLDRKIHKVAATQTSSAAQAVWTFSADGGFSTNPIVANGKVYATSRDGALYAVNDASTPTLAWKFQTKGPIYTSPAYKSEDDGITSTTQGSLYFTSNDMRAYAVNAATGASLWFHTENGQQVAGSNKLPGNGFYHGWPVIYQDKVIFTRASFGSGHTGEESNYLFCPPPHNRQTPCTVPDNVVPGTLAPITPGVMASMNINNNPYGTTFADYFETFPHYRNQIFYNRTTGLEVAFDIDNDGLTDAAPVGWSGDGGNTPPPIIVGNSTTTDTDDKLYFRTYTRSNRGFGSKTVAGWEVGSNTLTLPFSNDGGQSGFWPGDEPTSLSSSGSDIYWNHCCDRYVGGVDLSQPNVDFLANGDDSNRQWRYISSGGLPFFPFNNIGMPSNYYIEAVKFFWDPPQPAVFWNENDKVAPTPYNGKLYVILGNALIALGPGGLGSNAPLLGSAPNINLPNYSTTITETMIRSRLVDEVTKIVNAGHLKPSFMWSGNITSFRSRQLDEHMSHYWHNPAELHVILLKALPHLSDNPTLQNQVKTYLQAEFASYPPYNYSHMGFIEGNQRDSFIYPPAETAFGSFTIPNVGKGGTDFMAMGNWGNYPPYNLYAMWKYAQAGLGNPSTLLTNWGNKLEVPIEANFSSVSSVVIDSSNIQNFFKGFPLIHNAFIDGYTAYIELSKMAGRSQSSYSAYETELAKLQNWRKQNLMTFPNPQEPYMCEGECYFESLITYYNFAYLTPELAEFLRTNARSSTNPDNDVLAILQKYQDMAPFWMMVHNAETQGESAIQPYQQTHSLFQALARVKQASQTELIKYLDEPIVPVGDLYYIDNLVATLEASDTPISPPLSPTPTPDPDLDRDGNLDFLDLFLIVRNFFTNSCSFNFLGDCRVNIFDYNYLVSKFPVPTPEPSPIPTLSATPTSSKNPGPSPTNALATPTVAAPSPTPNPTQSTGLTSGTGHTEIPSSWTWPITAGSDIDTQFNALMDQSVNDAKSEYGSSPAKVVMLENSFGYLDQFALKATQAFPGALIVGTGPARTTYNAYTDNIFSEHGNRSLAVAALGGTSITGVRASGQHTTGQFGNDAALQITAGQNIANDLKTAFNPNQRNVVVYFGPGHTPNHKLILCGFKQGVAGTTNLCDPANPENPEKAGLPPLPAYVHIIGSPGYADANTVVNTSVVKYTVIGTLIQGTFSVAAAGLDGTPTASNISGPISQVSQELNGIPDHLFLSPGHPTLGAYDALRQQMTTLLPGTTIFGHEGGGEIGHYSTTGPALAVTNHLFMLGLKAN